MITDIRRMAFGGRVISKVDQAPVVNDSEEEEQEPVLVRRAKKG